jgi:hypothetical protein
MLRRARRGEAAASGSSGVQGDGMAGDEDLEPESEAVPAWTLSVVEVMRVASALYGGKRAEMESLEADAYALEQRDSTKAAAAAAATLDNEEKPAIIQGGALTPSAKEALCEVFEVSPQAAKLIAAWLKPQGGTPASSQREFLKQVCIDCWARNLDLVKNIFWRFML